MPVVEESVFINRPPEEVFDFLVKTENIPVWDTSVIQAEQVGDGSPTRSCKKRTPAPSARTWTPSPT